MAASENAWMTGEPDEVELDGRLLDQLSTRVRSDPKINIHSILVVKDNKLVFEEYFTGEDADWGQSLGIVKYDQRQRHDLRSVSKSIVSALVGIAISEGIIPGVDASVHELFPEYSEHIAPNKKILKLRHILTMTAGLDWFEQGDYTNPGNDEIRMMGSPDPIAFTLGRSLESKPGTVFKYNGGLPTLLGYLLEKGYGKRGDEIVREKLFEPLGIKDFDFRTFPEYRSGGARANSRGALAYASGLRLRPRDMARIGQVYLDGGRWRGEQVIPAEWVETSLTPHIGGYGYQWWIVRLDSQKASMWVQAARGNGGQRIYLLRPLNMTVVITAGNYDTQDVVFVRYVLTDYVFPAAGMNDMSFVSADR